MRKNIIKIILIDLASFILMILIPSIFYSIIVISSNNLGLPQSVWDLSENELETAAVALQGYFIQLVLIIALVLLLLILIWSLSRALVWRLSIQKKIKPRYLLKSLLLGLKWFPIGIIPVLLILMTLKENMINYALLTYWAVFTYFSMYLYLEFAKTDSTKIFKNLKDSIKNYRLIRTYILLIAIYFVISTILDFIQKKTLNITWAFILTGFITAIIYLIFFAYSRFIFIEKRG